MASSLPSLRISLYAAYVAASAAAPQISGERIAGTITDCTRL
jgi:hypothetical protein